MTNLLPDVASQLSEKVRLYKEFDPISYSLETWVSDDVLTNYHNECFDVLDSDLNDIIGKLSSIDKNNIESIPLSSEDDEFEMLPSNAEEYMPNGLSKEFTIEDDLLLYFDTFADTVVQSSDGGDTIRIEFSAKVDNPNLPYPFNSVQIDFNVNFIYVSTNRYDAANAQFIITYIDLYRGPLDNIGDRGANYYQPITATATYDEPVVGNPSTRLTKIGSTWSLNVSEAADSYTLDNGSVGLINFDFNFTIENAATKLSDEDIVLSNNTGADLNGALYMPILQWSEFTTTQSPNIKKKIAALTTGLNETQADLYIDFISSQLSPAYDIAIEALPNSFNYNKQSIIEAVINTIKARKAAGKISKKDSYRDIGKQSLAEETFVESANYALSELGIDITITEIRISLDDLAAIDLALQEKGITGFEAEGWYDWGVVPNCNTLDICSRLAEATFNEIPDFETLEEHPTIKWLSENFDYIESNMSETNEALDKVI